MKYEITKNYRKIFFLMYMKGF